MSHLVDIFLQPGKVFADLKEKPTFVLPFLLVVIVSLVGFWMYFAKVDGAWFIEQMLSANPEATAKDIEQARKVMPGATMMGYITMAGVVVGSIIIHLIMALYYLIAGKVAGQQVSFVKGLSLSTWSAMPSLLGAIVLLVGTFTMTPQTSLPSLSLLNIDPLLVELPMDHAWSGFAKGFSLLTPWMIFLGALGWRTWFRTGWGQAIFVAALPSVLYFGGVAIFALMK